MNPSPASGGSLHRSWAPFPDVPERVGGARPGAMLRLAERRTAAPASGLVGVIANARAHRNQRGITAPDTLPGNVRIALPDSQGALDDALAGFARARIGTLVIDGGDGTVRDVLGHAVRHFGDAMPTLALVPSGKTNALAIDLGLPRRWTLADVLAAVPAARTISRSPIEVRRTGKDEPVLRGFLFGAGNFVAASAIAQAGHRMGAFHGAAIAMSLAGTVVQTLFGGADNVWRRGERMTIEAGGRTTDQAMYLLLASTLERLPLGVKPFGPVRAGMKLLAVDAPPRRMALMVPPLLVGSQMPALAANGFHHVDTERFRVRLTSDFILDGEIYEGGDLTIRRGAPVEFLLP